MAKDNETNRVELVITPPKVYGSRLAQNIGARTTIGVLTQLIANSRTSILIASPFYQTYRGIKLNPMINAFKNALDRNVTLSVIGTREGIEVFKKWIKDIFLQGDIRLFRPKPNVEDDRLLGSHAKVLIVDKKYVYIGSANLTRSGLTDNLEIGTLLKGTIASKVSKLWDQLIEKGFLVEVSY